MKANNTHQNPEPIIHKFEVVKYNKHDTIYQLCFGQPTNELITQSVKNEKFQGFSKAYNLGLYFRVKNASSWGKSKQITGLWKTTRLNHFYGDQTNDKGKTLLMFKVDPESQTMCVYEYPKGYYPSRKTIDSLINQL
jgi:hypothetical protein